MKVLIFGATGMVGRGVLLECLRDPGVELVVTLGRTSTDIRNPRLQEIVHRDLAQYAGMEDSLTGFDACFFCLGIASAGMKEADYARITYPGMMFIFISGSGTDSSAKGRSMWARVKGRTENALLQLPLQAYMFRPGFIEPMDGIQSKTPMYRKFYTVLGPIFPLLRRALPNHVLSTRQIGQAMLNIARRGYAKRILEPNDIRAAAGQQP
jgi:uncharacterized protein YbjT (DUF2867 family)